jgi:hypothetical protein
VADEPGFPLPDRCGGIASEWRPAERQSLRPTATPETSWLCRSPSTGTCRNPPAPICPGSMACHRTSTRQPLTQLSPRSPARKAGRIRDRRSGRAPAAGKDESSVSPECFPTTGPQLEAGIPSLNRVLINRARLVRLDQCPLCLGSDQIPHRSEMTRCANNGSAKFIRCT